jgi:hypothetical protein
MIRALSVVSIVSLAAPPLAAQVRSHAPAPSASHFSGAFTAGYRSGRGFEAMVVARDFLGHSPLRARLGLRYAAVNAGRAMDARHVFINDNTNGTPEQSATTSGLKLDLLYPVHLLGQPHLYAFGGPRRAWYKADYRFVGGNEDFEVSSHHWGVGAGLENHYPMSPRVALTLAAGLDYYFPSTLYGHDTSYSPDGTTVNGRAGYSYSDADRAVGQPKLDPIMVLGIELRF